MGPESTTLYFTQGSADKVYQAHLTREPPLGWMVQFEYGRRGKPLRAGVKTKAPVPYEIAKKAYDKLVASKTAKGYTPKGTGVAYSNTKNAGNVTTFVPQLLNQVNQAEAERLFTEAPPGTIHMQIKHDGERRGVYINNKVLAANRRGLTTALQKDVADACYKFNLSHRHPLTLDTEDMGNHLIIFDVLHSGGANQMVKPFSERAFKLFGLLTLLVRQGFGTELRVDLPWIPGNMREFRAFIAGAQNANEEGVVIRDGRTLYTPGRPNSGGGCYKLKFVESATVVVHSKHPTKRSIGIAVHDGRRVVPVGNCSVPTNYDIPNVGELVEVQYLYAHPQGSLFQPVYKGSRPDQHSDAITMSQLKYKKAS